jgi:cytoskeletal protein RodZ
VESFGAGLRREREKQGVTLEEISLSTKIGTRFLRALEEDHFDQLPGGIFNKGFVRAYARQLRLDEEQIVAEYLVAAGVIQSSPGTAAPEGPELLPEPQESEGRGRVRVPWGAFAAGILIVAVGMAVWGFYRREKTAATLGVSVPSVQTKTSPPPSATSPAPVETSAPSAPQSSALLPAATAASVSEPAPAEPPASTDLSGSFTVLIKAREDSWLAITADGKEVMQDMLVAPAERSIAAQREVVVRAGNVGAVDFFFNGRKLPVQGDYDQVKTLTFDLNGLRPAAPKAQAGGEASPQT